MPSPSSKRPAQKAIPRKCLHCATLSAEHAKALHGPDGTGCWDPSICYSRRSYARHRDRRNQARRQRRLTVPQEQIVIEPTEEAAGYSAVLVVYRSAGADSPIHAVGAEIWQGQEKRAIVQPIHCSGMVPSQVHAYVRKVLSRLDEQYGIKKFASQERLDPHLCPLRPCPHHSIGEL